MFDVYFFINLLKYAPLSSKFLKLSKEAAEGLNKTVFFEKLSKLIWLKIALTAFSKLKNFLNIILFFRSDENFL